MKAFPMTHPSEDCRYIDSGMDLRDYFAAKATEQDVQEYMWQTTINTGHVLAKIQIRNREEARFAYADAMLKAREK